MQAEDYKIISRLLDASALANALTGLCEDILALRLQDLAIIGIRTRGEHLAARIKAALEKRMKTEIPIGYLDVSFYRDDTRARLRQPVVQSTHIPFDINDKNLLLVDDVLFTGRSVRAAMDELMDFGRPARIVLSVLVDRGHRELPIRADLAGATVDTKGDEMVRVKLREVDGEDEVLLLSKKS